MYHFAPEIMCEQCQWQAVWNLLDKVAYTSPGINILPIIKIQDTSKSLN